MTSTVRKPGSFKLATGFTLSELLIALAILGLIAIFTIPKILTSQADNQKKAVFKETISAVYAILNEGISTGQLDKTTNVSNYFLPRLNGVKRCSNNAQANGCWPQQWLGTNTEQNQGGVMLHNGANITGLDFGASASGYTGFVLDWDGPNGNNVQGDDQILLVLCLDDSGAGFSTRCSREGTLVPNPVVDDFVANLALWDFIFQ